MREGESFKLLEARVEKNKSLKYKKNSYISTYFAAFTVGLLTYKLLSLKPELDRLQSLIRIIIYFDFLNEFVML